MVNKMGSMGEYFFRVYLYLIIIGLLEQVSQCIYFCVAYWHVLTKI